MAIVPVTMAVIWIVIIRAVRIVRTIVVIIICIQGTESAVPHTHPGIPVITVFVFVAVTAVILFFSTYIFFPRTIRRIIYIVGSLAGMISGCAA